MPGVERRAGTEHGASDSEQAVRDRAQGAAVGVAASAQGLVLGPAEGVVLDRDPAPVIGGVDQAGLGGPAADDAPRLAGAPGDRGHPAQAAQGLVVSGVQRAGSLCEQRGEDGSPDARQRREDRPVALLTRLPRGGLFGGGEAGDQARQRAVRVAQLAVEQAQPLGEKPDMGGGGADDARGDGHGVGAQGGEDRSARKRRKRCFFNSLATEEGRTRRARSGVGASCQRASVESAAKSAPSSRNCG